MNNQELRNKLRNITQAIKIDYNRDKYREDIEALKKAYSHSIILKEKVGHDRYNCYMYALDLHVDPIRSTIFNNHKTGRDPFPDEKFIMYCLEKDYLIKTKWEDIKDGDIILYFDNNNPKHAGKIFSKRVISKWGDLDLWNHDIWEIPANYGKEAVFYKKLEKNDVLKYYSHYTGISLNQLNAI